MMQTVLTFSVLAFVTTVFAGPSGFGADEGAAAPLLVGVKSAPPFVIVDESSGNLSGFSIDLVRLIAAQMEPPRKVTFQIHQNLEEHLNAVRSGQVDLGIAATSFSSERQRTLDFSVAFYQSGLDIAVRPEGSGIMLWDILSSSELVRAFLWLAVFLLVCVHVIWLTEKGTSETFDDRWLPGLGQAAWWTIVTMTTVGYGDFVPRKPLSRVFGVAVIMAGIILFGVVVGVFSSALTLQNLASDIQRPSDLRGRPVTVVRDTVAERVMTHRGADVIRVDSLEEALAAVESGEADAAVHDFPQLRHTLSRHSRALVQVGRLFSIQGYGITYPVGSNLRKRVNVALLELTEGAPSEYTQLSERWFGIQ
ncbi:MAG TPA: transporter substrate-binding domain-containing protein [Planctomycetes bacterium]|nr:transporter substrate-binding domain-containing protein [Fuerstiella sp.]HIK92368.1 transporter substrate-binding domain-containing protein [Planctomycetota bacterium]